MISFIVIGLNEAEFLDQCLKSIFCFTSNKTEYYEVIYVDSGSTDNNIKTALKYKNLKVLELTGDKNAAIARNIGAKVAKSEYLVFIDGDMVLNESFANKYLNENQFIKTPYFSGDILNYFYDSRFNFLHKEYYWRKPIKTDRLESKTGGLFCITRQLWKMNSGMKNYYRRSQDNDFGLRLAKKNIKLLRKKELFAVHHTISYTNSSRLKKILKNGDFLYRGLLYRENLFNEGIIEIIFKVDYSLITLVISLILAMTLVNPVFLLLYLMIVNIRAVRAKFKYNENLLLYLTYIVVRDIQVLFSFMLFYPKKEKNINFRISQ
ncbi:MAG: glycosyltransferase family 2 protein [Mariniphaga sp.]|nr:glycosyltransferase family 2 protein [Mariniphaga sp.]